MSNIYSLSSDFGNNLNLSQLHEIILGTGSITTALVGITNTGDVVDIEFISTLPGGEKTILDSIVATYVRADKAIINVTTTGSDNTIMTLNSAQTVNRTLTLPDVTDTLVGVSATQTLTNKTLDADLNTLSNIANAQIKSAAAIDAAKIADGSVSNTEFQYLNGTTSAIQTQINTHTGDTANPHNVTKAQVGLANVENILNNTTTTSPNASADSNAGYTVGSRWIDTSTNDVYVCVDASVGAAVWVSSTASYYSASNVGVGGVPVFKQLNGTDFEFKNINVGSSKLTVTNDAGNNEIDLDVTEGQINIQNLLNAPTGTVVGTTDTQTLTNKTIDADQNALSNIDNANIKAGAAINATKIANGTVSNTEFQYLDGVTSAIQTQLDAKVDLTMTQNLDLNSNKIVNLANPTADNDAANKAYVDSVASGLSVKDSVRITTTAALTLATDFENGDTIDGVVLSTGDRILIKNQTNGTENGIYTVNASGAPTRSADFASGSSAAGVFVFVQEGTTNADSGWVCSSDAPNDVIGTNNITFTQFSGAGQIIAGDGLAKIGNVLNVDLKANGGLVIESAKLALNLAATNITGQLSAAKIGSGTVDNTELGYLNGVTSSIQTQLNSKAAALAPTVVSSTTKTSTTSGTYTLVSGLTSTPASGTYLVNVSGSVRSTRMDQTSYVGIFVDGTLVNHTEREIYNVSGTGNNFAISIPVHLQAHETVNGSQAIEVRYKTTNGNALNFLNRSMILIKIS